MIESKAELCGLLYCQSVVEITKELSCNAHLLSGAVPHCPALNSDYI